MSNPPPQRPSASPATAAVGLVVGAVAMAGVLALLSVVAAPGLGFGYLIGLVSVWALIGAVRSRYSTAAAVLAVVPLICLLAGAYRLSTDILAATGQPVAAVVATRHTSHGGPRTVWTDYTFNDPTGHPIPGQLRVDSLLQPWGPHLDEDQPVRLLTDPTGHRPPRLEATVTVTADALAAGGGLAALGTIITIAALRSRTLGQHRPGTDPPTHTPRQGGS